MYRGFEFEMEAVQSVVWGRGRGALGAYPQGILGPPRLVLIQTER